MSDSPIEHVFAGIPVSDYSNSVDWYASVFGRPPDVIVRENHESMWQLADRAWIYVVHDPERAGRSLVTILVADLQVQLSALAKRGIARVRTETLPGVYMKGILTDADGNMVTFAQTIDDPE